MRHGLAWVCAVGGLLLVGMAEGQPPAPGPALDKTTLAEVRKLQEKRRDVLREAMAARERQFQTGRGTLDGVIETSQRLLVAELDLATTGAERIAAYERLFEKARMWFEIAKARHAAARGTAIDTLEAQAALLAAEIGLRKAGGKPKKMKK